MSAVWKSGKCCEVLERQIVIFYKHLNRAVSSSDIKINILFCEILVFIHVNHHGATCFQRNFPIDFTQSGASEFVNANIVTVNGKKKAKNVIATITSTK